MHWLFSKNAKEIGTFHLIFAAFAGMIGTVIFLIYLNEDISTIVHITSNIFPVETGVQTEDLDTNTVECKEVGVQTEDIDNNAQSLDPISDIPQQQPVDEGVQTSVKSLFTLFNEWLKELSGLGSEGVRTLNDTRIEEWMNNLEQSESIPSTDESIPSTDEIGEGSGSNNQPLVEVSDLIYDDTDFISDNTD
jgi:hypothetical protein